MTAPSIGERLARLRSAIGAPVVANTVRHVIDVCATDGAEMASIASAAGASFPAVVGGSFSAPDHAARRPTPGMPIGSNAPMPGPSLAERIARARAGRGSMRADHGIDALRRATGGVACGDDLLCVETRLPLPHLHGRIRITGDVRRPLALPIRAGETLVKPAGDVLLLDTETSGLAGGAGTFAFLVGLARVEGDALVVRQYLATRIAGEAALLAQVRAAVAAAGALVTFNGKSFDVPLLKGRFALRRETHPFDGLPHSDLLHASRRHLRDDWSDCRLRTAEERALGFHRVDDLPGAEVPEVWRRWLALGDARDLPRVLAHNCEDLVSLLALVQLLGTIEGRLPLFSAPRGGIVTETRKIAGHGSGARVQRAVQDPQAVEVLV